MVRNPLRGGQSIDWHGTLMDPGYGGLQSWFLYCLNDHDGPDNRHIGAYIHGDIAVVQCQILCHKGTINVVCLLLNILCADSYYIWEEDCFVYAVRVLRNGL